MLVRNARIENNEELKDIRIIDGVFKEIGKLQPREEEEILDLEGKLLLPPFSNRMCISIPVLLPEILSGTCPVPCLKGSNAGASVKRN